VQPLYVSLQCRIITRYPQRGEQICMSNHIRTRHLPRLRGASHIDAFWMVCPFSRALQLWLLLHRRSFSSTHRYHKKKRHAMIPGRSRTMMSVPGLPIIDCVGSCNSSVPRFAKVSTIDVMKKTIFERALHCAAVCCRELQCAAVCCSVLQYVVVCCSMLQCVAVWCSVL